MFIFRKSRFLLIISCLFLSFAFYIANNNVNERSYEITQVSAVPASEKVVIIDAGHGGADGGAVSSNGITEAELNLKIALKLQNLLELSGTTVLLTRSDENVIYEIDSKTLRQKKVDDTKKRVKLGNESAADIFVSIHMNKIPQTQYSGWQTFYSLKNESGKLLAQNIQNALNETMNKENSRVPKSINNIYIVDNVTIPLCLVECGFLSNQNELSNLMQDDYQDKLAFGIYSGINDYFKTK